MACTKTIPARVRKKGRKAVSLTVDEAKAERGGNGRVSSLSDTWTPA